ncbi:hypothetical protein DFJ77DRAFT_435422 [Powellomyces hirtus]|nr:hypothetical protein DFJ77DRAFT_435422 [Powellomyces hirtus]
MNICLAQQETSTCCQCTFQQLFTVRLHINSYDGSLHAVYENSPHAPLVLYVADFDHPGLNNNFLVRISDSRAIMYNDRSVLENYHLSSAWKLLTQPENNFLCNMSAGDFKGVREQVIDMVLATDLSQHFSVLTQFKSRVSSASFSPEEGKEDRWLLWKILIKLADVSNPSKDWRVYGTWVRLILEEFYMQGDVERERGMEISSFMDRNSPSIPGSQNGFIEFIVAPLFMAYDSWMPIPSIMEDLALNREFWYVIFCGYLRLSVR